MNTGVRLPPSLLAFLKSIWLFPSLIFLSVCTASALGVSGSSVGVYDNYFNGVTHESELGRQPRPVRSDEWLVTTQLTLAQHAAGFPLVNTNIGTGQNMSVVADVPYLEWSAIFKPQNWSFFVLPLQQAFAFKWWLLAGLLAIATYFSVLKLLPQRHALAILLGGIMVFSPMVQWWYQSITIVPLYTTLFILVTLINLHAATTRVRRALWAGALAYLLVMFALVQYPPFQIPCAIVGAVFYLGYVLGLYRAGAKWRTLWRPLLLAVGAGVLALGIVALFIMTRLEAVQAVTHTAYPGQRAVAPGGLPPLHLVSNHLAPLQQSNSLAPRYVELGPASNQSEMSNVAFPVLGALALGLFALWRGSRSGSALVRTQLLACLGLAGVFLSFLLVPFGAELYKLMALHLVPPTRLLLGFGLLSLLILVLSIRLLSGQRRPVPSRWLWLIGGLLTLISVGLTLLLMHRNPGYVPYLAIGLALALPFPVFLTLLLAQKLKLALASLLLFCIGSTVLINPLQRNLDELTSTHLSQTIQRLTQQNPNARWATTNFLLQNYALANGAPSLSGTYLYPQLNLWTQVDPTAEPSIYNRYANVFFAFDDSLVRPTLELRGPDGFTVHTPSCAPQLGQLNLRYIITDAPASLACFEVAQQLHYASKTIYILERR